MKSRSPRENELKMGEINLPFCFNAMPYGPHLKLKPRIVRASKRVILEGKSLWRWVTTSSPKVTLFTTFRKIVEVETKDL